MVSRRVVLGAGLGGLVLVGSAGVWRVTRMPDSAYGPWRLSSTPPADIRLDAFRHAILAPNPHNRQPWVIKLDGENEALISCDLERRLPQTDPYDRQITIGFGTFLEIARIAAAERGYRMETELSPDGEAHPRLDDRPIARLKFVKHKAVQTDPLFAAIPLRRSNREVYAMNRKTSDKLLEKITKDGGTYSANPEFVKKLRTQILKAIETEMTTPEPYMESVRLMRIGHSEVDAMPDGISLTGPMIEAGKLAGQINREQLSDIGSKASQIGRDGLAQTYGSIPALFWINTPNNTRGDQIEAGRQYVRANLRANAPDEPIASGI